MSATSPHPREGHSAQHQVEWGTIGIFWGAQIDQGGTLLGVGTIEPGQVTLGRVVILLIIDVNRNQRMELQAI